MKTLWIVGLLLLLCATVFSSITKSLVASPGQPRVDNLGSLSMRADPYALVTSAKSHDVAERNHKIETQVQAPPKDKPDLSEYIRLHQTRIESLSPDAPGSHSVADSKGMKGQPLKYSF